VISLRQDDDHGAGDHGAAEQAVPVLRGEPYVRELSAGDGQVRLYVDDGGTALPELIRLLDSRGIGIRSISMSEPTLDDVFLRQTGRSLRDEGAADQNEREAAA
jgi:ABC-2 type transport system ATP-binding protein